jgi:CheY-like chemotaxis protein
VLAPEDRPSVRAIAGTSVLVVDDDAAARALMVELLSRMGCEALGAESADAALEAALARRPDVVLMDLEMPGTDGLEAARRLRRAGVGSRIFALTGTSTDRERASAESAGMEGWLTKPVAIERLTQEIAAGRGRGR